MDLTIRGFRTDEAVHEVQEIDGVPFGGFAADPADGHFEGGVEGERAMAHILETVTLPPPWRERQHRVTPIQRLDAGLLVHAEHGGVGRRIEVESEDRRGLLFKFRVRTLHVGV